MPKETFDSLQRFLFFGSLLGVTSLFLWILWPFVMSIFWAVVSAILLYPVFVSIRNRVRSPSLAALTTLLGAIIVIGVPLYFVGYLAAQEAIGLFQRISTQGLNVGAILANPFVHQTLSYVGISSTQAAAELSVLAHEASAAIAAQSISIGAATLSFLLKFGVMLYLLFFFLRDGEALASYLQRLIPLGDVREKLLFIRFSSTTRAVVKGTLIVSIVQGVIGAILFFIAGIQSPILWGAIMAFTATIPAVGPFIVWLPAGLILLATGAIWQGLLVILGGIFLIGTVDNLLRPVLVGRDIEMPDALVLVAILGGIATFGIAGVIIGPVIGALFLSIWDLFGKDFSEELSSRG